MAVNRRGIITVLVLAALAFLGWRLVRPLNIFIVSDAFERPISTREVPAPLQTLSAAECGGCHPDFYAEWRTTIHSRAWTDPYFQTDWQFDNEQQICRNCHTPLDRQQPDRVLGFRDREKWDPVLEPNPDFDAGLQHEGVTCAACHLRAGKIVGVLGNTRSPHPVSLLDDPNQVCVRCHVVEGDRWDTFFRFPPCGTVAEIEASIASPGFSGELAVQSTAELGCVACHMPAMERSLVEGGEVRTVRQHLWRGGHDPQMVKRGLKVILQETESGRPGRRVFRLTLTNVGAAHYLPTGTPDRHLVVRFRLMDAEGRLLAEQEHRLVRTVLWRPFIVDLRDTRLPRWQPRSYDFGFSTTGSPPPAVLQVDVHYYLVAESRRKRIGYDNTEPTHFEVFKQRVGLPAKGVGS
ncbi:MAG TPA: hypothetical protein ENK49_05050 [Gammaproteobacteria bacterium]|nr:hypothetical protein [Gammaproteobacteria bacterium]